MKCPWVKQVQKKMYHHKYQPDDATASEVIITAFGECERTECPFFELRTNNCKRCK